jgi:hypothetical protein
MLNSAKIIIGGRLFEPPEGLEITNFLDPSVSCFKARRRAKIPVTELVLHETVTTSVKTTIAVLRRRALGVHFIIGPDGAITQHNDLALDRVAHASPHNKRSVGIEVVQPYYPEYLPESHRHLQDARHRPPTPTWSTSSSASPITPERRAPAYSAALEAALRRQSPSLRSGPPHEKSITPFCYRLRLVEIFPWGVTQHYRDNQPIHLSYKLEGINFRNSRLIILFESLANIILG